MKLLPTSPTMTSKVPVERLFRASTTLHRSTQELSLQAAELDAALTRDGVARFRQALAGQQTVRIAGAIGLGVAAALTRGGNLAVIAIAAATCGIYLAVVMRASASATGKESRFNRVAAVISLADAVATSVLCALAASGGNADALFWILVVGAVAAPAMAFAFAGPAASLGVVLYAVGYITSSLLMTGFNVGNESTPTAIATVTIWATGVWLLTRHFGGVRERLDWLRTYAKLAEVGDVGSSEMISTSGGSDDFALLARSFEVVHSRLYEQIGSDPLTGCANRRGLEKQLLGVCRLARRQGGVVSVAAIDIDHFKVINDTHGHPEGDRVIRQLATIMMNTARDTDTVARLGGDEFVVILPDSDLRGTRTFAERLRERVSQTGFGPPGASIAVTISIGVAVAEGKAQLEPDRLLAEADQALYDAKAGGRDRVSGRGVGTSAAGA
ncbi:MAG TPA: GGDEF domain-containing protein [Gemmatimonadaceae bacterium]